MYNNRIYKNGIKVSDVGSIAGTEVSVFGALVNANDVVSATKGDLTVSCTKNASGNYATSRLVFSTARNVYYSFSYRYDAATNVGRTDNDTVASISLQTDMGYTRGNTLHGIVVDKTNQIMYQVAIACGNNGTSGRADWAAISIK